MKIPSAFTDFDSVINAVSDYDGVGIRVSEKLIAIDLDHCIKGKKMTAEATSLTP